MSAISRRGFASVLAGSIALRATSAGAQTPSGTATFTILDFFGQEPRAWEAVQTYANPTYNYLAGSAASASTRRLPGDLGLKPVTRATWELIWTAESLAAGVEVAHCDRGFINYTQFAELRPNVAALPDIQFADVTVAINAAIAQRREKFLVCRAHGDGATTPIIFGSSIELVWS